MTLRRKRSRMTITINQKEKKMYSLSAVSNAAVNLGIDFNTLADALERGELQAHRASRRNNDGAVAYQPLTAKFALFQAVRDGYVSRLVFDLAK